MPNKRANADWRSRAAAPARRFALVAMMNFFAFMILRASIGMGALSGYRDATGSYMKLEHSSRMVRVSDFWWRFDRAHSVATFAFLFACVAFAAMFGATWRDGTIAKEEARHHLAESESPDFWRSTVEPKSSLPEEGAASAGPGSGGSR